MIKIYTQSLGLPPMVELNANDKKRFDFDFYCGTLSNTCIHRISVINYQYIYNVVHYTNMLIKLNTKKCNA